MTEDIALAAAIGIGLLMIATWLVSMPSAMHRSSTSSGVSDSW
jgi:hypothetical protein